MNDTFILAMNDTFIFAMNDTFILAMNALHIKGRFHLPLGSRIADKLSSNLKN